MIFRATSTICLSLGILFASASGLRAQNLVTNGDFELGVKGWFPFVPGDVKSNDCAIEASSDNPRGMQSHRMSCKAFSRFAATTVIKDIEPVPGDRYRLSLWVRAGDDFEVAQGTPGFFVRVTFFSDPKTWAAADGGNFHLSMGNHTSIGNAPASAEPLPKEWTKIEGVFEIPPKTAFMNIATFFYKAEGSVFVDDVVLEKVDNSTPLSN